MEYEVKSPKKLIEVALPLDKINAAASKEKSIRHGHPSTLHLWWARRPLAAARAVIFAQMVNDPSWQWCMEHGNAIPPNHLKGSWANSRKRLFKIIEDMVLWENIGNVSVMEKARKEIRRSWEETCRLNSNHPNASELFNPSNVPAFHDPFAGGGALPLEAQRLGLEAYASDLNPVAVLINKAMIEIPPKFSCSEPLGPIEPAGSDGSNYHHAQVSQGNEWRGAQGLAEDVRRYGVWLKNEAEKTIGHLYPKMLITHEIAGDRPDLATFIGEEMTVIAWLWARTVKSPNPVYSQVDVPLVSSFILSSKKGNEVWIDPVIQGNEYKFIVHMGTPNKEANEGTSAGKRNAFSCIMSKTPIDYNYIRKEGQAGRIGARLLAVVVEGKRERIYLSPMKGMEDIAFSAKPNWKSDLKLPENTRDFKTPNYGMDSYGDLFTSRQLVALNTFAGLISVVREKVYLDSINAGMSNNGLGLDSGGIGAKAYSEAVCVYLSIAVSRISSYWSSIDRKSTRLNSSH